MRVVIVGAGGFGNELAEYVCDVYEHSGELSKNILFLDDIKTVSEIKEVQINKNIDDFIADKKDIFFVAIGDTSIREAIYKSFKKKKYKFGTLIHPTAYISNWANIQEGSIVCPHAIVGFKASIGQNVIINTNAAIGHHVEIGQSSVICPNSTVAGNAKLGSSSFIGSNAVISPGKSVGKNASVSAGSVVYRNVKPNKLAVGNPAKVK